MINKRAIKSSGQISGGLLVFGVVVIIVIIIIFIIIKIVSSRPPETVISPGGEEKVYQPVYEAIIGDIKFISIEAKDKGNLLQGSESKNPEKQENLTTRERFIIVTIGAQNIGKQIITPQDKVWEIKEIIDGEGRKFDAAGSEADPWIPTESNCGASLKPAFSPTPCTKIYEVAKVSTDLKVKVFVEEKGITAKKGEALIDLKF